MEENDGREYKEIIIGWVHEINDYKFLRQIYTIIHQYIKRAEAI